MKAPRCGVLCIDGQARERVLSTRRRGVYSLWITQKTCKEPRKYKTSRFERLCDSNNGKSESSEESLRSKPACKCEPAKYYRDTAASLKKKRKKRDVGHRARRWDGWLNERKRRRTQSISIKCNWIEAAKRVSSIEDKVWEVSPVSSSKECSARRPVRLRSRSSENAGDFNVANRSFHRSMFIATPIMIIWINSVP